MKQLRDYMRETIDKKPDNLPGYFARSENPVFTANKNPKKSEPIESIENPFIHSAVMNSPQAVNDLLGRFRLRIQETQRQLIVKPIK